MSDARPLVSELLERSGARDAKVIAAKVGDRIRDLHTRLSPEEAALPISPIRIDDPEALWVLRHSAAHIMADSRSSWQSRGFRRADPQRRATSPILKFSPIDGVYSRDEEDQRTARQSGEESI